MKEIRDRHGPDALAFLNSPRCSNEEAYLLQKLARAVIGTNNVDHGTGVYCNNSINVLLDMLGVPATTNSISELARSEVIVVDGVDLARQLPTIGGRGHPGEAAGAHSWWSSTAGGIGWRKAPTSSCSSSPARSRCFMGRWRR